MPGYAGTEDDDIYEGDLILADYVNMFGGDDTVRTYGGNDNIVAGDGDNHIEAGTGHDTIISGDGNDWLSGGDGNDFIVDDGAGFFLDQKIFGGSGNDQIVVRGGGLTYIYGGSGDDTFQFVRAGDITEAWIGVPNGRIAEDAGSAGGHDKIILSTGWAGFVMSDNVEDLIADNSNAQDDRITWDNRIDDTVLGVEVTGNASHNNMMGSIVRDILRGETGNDTLNAYFGEGDRLYGGSGNDDLILHFAKKTKLEGGSGDDTYVLRQWTTDAADSIVEQADQGDDTIEVAGATIDLNRANLASMENLTFTSDSSGRARTVTGNAHANTILTNDANDTVYGLSGNDEIRSGRGADWLEGGDGDDTLDGGTENDKLEGGAGKDYMLGGAGDDWMQGNDGDDLIQAGDGTDLVYGGAGNDSALGQWGGDFIHGEAGNDTVSGDSGGDWVYGGEGSDKLYGGADNDRLNGNAGADVLYGGTGADRFVFSMTADSTVSGYDRVMDFVQGNDKIDLSGIDANVTAVGNQAFHFTGAQPFFGSEGDLFFRSTLAGAVVGGDVNGDGMADFRILVTGVFELQATDFIL